MLILSTPTFDRSVKKFAKNQKVVLDKAVKALLKNPLIGEAKKGDLRGIYVYKFKILDKQFLLGYQLPKKNEIKLLMIGTHENFYRDLKK
ncbi:MAG: type II toxin-antitoxin system RelE/ParE family toxin [Actinobacteria bacterium]|nr:type II toxin-antitoxin system RelE/ParE family toxin [Actinomycetota bacterium]